MGITMKIHNVKNIEDFELDIPVEKGLYALTGENGSGKSTVISCAATSFYVPSLYAYFGEPKEGSEIDFYFGKKHRHIRAQNGKWLKPIGYLGITGFYEGSIVFEKHNVVSKTIYNLKHNKHITTSTLERLCNILDCTPNDIIEFVKDEN